MTQYVELAALGGDDAICTRFLTPHKRPCDYSSPNACEKSKELPASCHVTTRVSEGDGGMKWIER